MLSKSKRFLEEIAALSRILNWTDAGRYVASIACNLPSIFREKSLGQADESYRPERLTVKAFGQNFRLANPCLSLVREIYGRRIYFPKPDWVPKAGDAIVDLGANVGLFSLLCAGLGANVVAVEAQSGFLPLAEAMLRENGCLHRVKLVHGIVGANTGCLADPERRAHSSHFGRIPPEMSMRQVLSLHSAGEVDFLKIDIEGSEFALFRGDTDWLAGVRRIAMEVHPEFGDAKVIQRHLSDRGYKSWLIPSWRDNGGVRRFPGHCYAER